MAQFGCGSLIQERSSEFKASMNQSIQSILHSKNNEAFKEETVATLNNHQFLCDPSHQTYHRSYCTWFSLAIVFGKVVFSIYLLINILK